MRGHIWDEIVDPHHHNNTRSWKVSDQREQNYDLPTERENLLNSMKHCEKKAYLRLGFSLLLLNVITSLPYSVEILSKILMMVSSNSALEKAAWESRAFIYLPFDLGDSPPPLSAQRGNCPSICCQLTYFVPKTTQEFPV